MTTPDQETALARVKAAYDANQQTEDALARAVDAALRAGVSFERIGNEVFGISRQAFWERHRRRRAREQQQGPTE